MGVELLVHAAGGLVVRGELLVLAVGGLVVVEELLVLAVGGLVVVLAPSVLVVGGNAGRLVVGKELQVEDVLHGPAAPAGHHLVVEGVLVLHGGKGAAAPAGQYRLRKPGRLVVGEDRSRRAALQHEAEPNQCP